MSRFDVDRCKTMKRKIPLNNRYIWDCYRCDTSQSMKKKFVLFVHSFHRLCFCSCSCFLLMLLMCECVCVFIYHCYSIFLMNCLKAFVFLLNIVYTYLIYVASSGIHHTNLVLKQYIHAKTVHLHCIIWCKLIFIWILTMLLFY